MRKAFQFSNLQANIWLILISNFFSSFTLHNHDGKDLDLTCLFYFCFIEFCTYMYIKSVDNIHDHDGKVLVGPFCFTFAS